MSDQEKQFNNEELDLKAVRQLIGEADGGDFALDDILAEFGTGTPEVRRIGPEEGEEIDLPWPEPARSARPAHNVVQFPGGAAAVEDEEEPVDGPEEAAEEPESEPAEEPAVQEEPEAETETPAGEASAEESRIIEFPKPENPLLAFVKNLRHRAGACAEGMFEKAEGDTKEARRLEKLIPGTDREEQPQKPPRERKPRPQEPMPEDIAPRELARSCSRAIKGMRLRDFLLGLLTILAVVQLLLPARWLPAILMTPRLRAGVAFGLLLAGILLSLDLMKAALERLKKGKVEMDVITLLAALFTLADSVMLMAFPGETGRLPYGAAALAGLWALQHGTYQRRRAVRLSCRTAGASAQPYRVTMDAGKWNGRYTFTKWSGTAEGFGSQIQVPDGAQRMFRRLAPVLLVGDTVLALLAALAAKQPQNLIWGLSTLFTMSAALGASLTYGCAFWKVARRLSQSGAALAGWPGVAEAALGNGVLITDTDLFPPGYVEMNGFKVFGEFPVERVVGYTATMIRASGSGLTKLFHDQLRSLGGLMRSAEKLCCYEGGGLSAEIHRDQVLVGSAAFMNLMEIPLPQGLNVKNAVFCAINGELAGIFALSYTLPDTVFPCMEALMREKIGPVLATRDFNLTPAMLQQRFKLAADRMDFPPVERRRELSASDQSHSGVLTAVLCREGLAPFAEAVTAAKRLRWATLISGILCCVSALLGMVLGAYLVAVSAFGSLSALNMLCYLLAWAMPVCLLSSWTHRF